MDRGDGARAFCLAGLGSCCPRRPRGEGAITGATPTSPLSDKGKRSNSNLLEAVGLGFVLDLTEVLVVPDRSGAEPAVRGVHDVLPVFWTDGSYFGPAAIFNAHRFIFDSRDQGAEERLEILNDREGILRCRTTSNCTEACPRGIEITKAIKEVKQALLFRRV